MKRYICFLLAVCILCLCGSVAFAAEEEGFGNFTKTNEYFPGRFADVSEGEWYEEYVAAAYELGLVKGMDEHSFAPKGEISVGETIAIAARLHSIYHKGAADFVQGEPWYQVYVDYAAENGIIEAAPEDCGETAQRKYFAAVLAGALPEEALAGINTVEDDLIPDVKMSDSCAGEIYALYRAGVLTGNDSYGRFAPNMPIERGAVAAIISRMAYRSLRVKFQLEEMPDHELTQRAAMDDSFFEDAAILGNSLIDGLRLYSNLDTADFYCGTSMTVNSACTKKNVKLSNGSMGTQLDAMAQQDYGKVYIELGINEIGGSTDSFISSYGDMLDRIRADQSDADIYVMAITPVSLAKSESSSVFNMTRVNMYNEALRELAMEKGCYYLDVCTPLLGSDGYLPAEDTWDGVHLTVSKYAQWEELIRTHYAD